MIKLLCLRMLDTLQTYELRCAFAAYWRRYCLSAEGLFVPCPPACCWLGLVVASSQMSASNCSNLSLSCCLGLMVVVMRDMFLVPFHRVMTSWHIALLLEKLLRVESWFNNNPTCWSVRAISFTSEWVTFSLGMKIGSELWIFAMWIDIQKSTVSKNETMQKIRIRNCGLQRNLAHKGGVKWRRVRGGGHRQSPGTDVAALYHHFEWNVLH